MTTASDCSSGYLTILWYQSFWVSCGVKTLLRGFFNLTSFHRTLEQTFWWTYECLLVVDTVLGSIRVHRRNKSWQVLLIWICWESWICASGKQMRRVNAKEIVKLQETCLWSLEITEDLMFLKKCSILDAVDVTSSFLTSKMTNIRPLFNSVFYWNQTEKEFRIVKLK